MLADPDTRAESSARSANQDEQRAATSSTAWHTLSSEIVAQQLKTDRSNGLSQTEATQRLQKLGPNQLSQAKQRTAFQILVQQFRSLIVLLLAVATAIAFAMGDSIEAIAILVVIIINAAIGFFTEWKAANALLALQKQAVRVAHVVRDGKEAQIPAVELVPGDLIVLVAGAGVPADGRIIECVRMQIEESALTGESSAVTKSAVLVADQNAVLAERLDMAFLGTTVTSGRGRLIVTATSTQTEVGKIGVLIDQAATRATPIELKLAQLGRLLVIVTLVLCTIIVLTGWLRGVSSLWHMLEIGLSLAIAAVPEGLPAVATMTLALGMQRMATMRALVRRLPAVETLGSTTVICTDKTGTLTKNEMTVCVYLLGQRRIEVTGSGYAMKGMFREKAEQLQPETDDHLTLALRIGTLCNDAKVERNDGRETVLGDATEAALIVASEKANVKLAELATQYPRVGEVPFDSLNKFMSTVHTTPDGKKVTYVKGAPAIIVDACSRQVAGTQVQSLTDQERQRWKDANEQLADGALRVLALAYRELEEGYDESDLSRDLTFVGLVGMSDPLREEAKAAIATCREAGIRTVMITGDQKTTAAEIAKQLGIDVDQDGKSLRTIHGRELEGLDDEGWNQAVAEASVFARVSPQHKLQIVETLQRQGHIVAMTGDGVNDAPALKKADIGIAMGIKGTEVAKENADLVITDDNFASIVGAVEQGSIIYGNILRFIHYLLSCNFSEILTVFIAMMIGWPLPLVALQILWLNLITDIFPAFALALEPAAPDVMKRAPRDPKEPLLPPQFIILIAWQGLLITSVTLLAFKVGLQWHGDEGDGLRRATTMAFMTLALSQVLHVFNARSQTNSMFNGRLFTNAWLWAAIAFCVALQVAAVYVPILQRVLRTVPPTLPEWGVIAVCSIFPIVVVEVVKIAQRALRSKPE